MTDISNLNSKFASTEGSRVHYHDIGEGDAIVLLHGGGPGAYGYSNFSRNVGPLAARNRVIVVDLPGFGRSDHRNRPEGIYKAMAQAVGEAMDHAGIAKASLIGNSLGGGTALRFALDRPDRVDKLVLMGPGGGMPVFSPMPTEGLTRMFKFYEDEGPTIEKLEKVIDLLVFNRSSITPDLVQERFVAATMASVLANPPLRGGRKNDNDDLWRHGIGGIQAPTLLLWGRDDRVVPLDAALLFLKAIPNADLHVFSKCGHWAQWERAEEFNEVVGSFLARH
jgi:4,5:9,10-diseco-3-hydroxy-5,9,17-trioxoandrosta-1(10),2-diene-4-oate hydrolase